MDDQGKALTGANVQIDGFTRTTDEFGRVPFLLNTGRHKVIVETHEIEVETQSGKTKKVVYSVK